ncbi:hypothetical protein [Burkholderia stagnalis]|uniref:hypothetical protein n=1 Tax=Burkholderia stagnalis TaxID=1503054 RepID=UPI0018C6BDAC|nr:hypothetical protein [Burkholderia stagnalis]
MDQQLENVEGSAADPQRLAVRADFTSIEKDLKCSNADHGDSVFPEMSQRRQARHAAGQAIDATSYARFHALNIQNPLIKFIEMTQCGNPDMPCVDAGLPGFRAIFQRPARFPVFHSEDHFNRPNGATAAHALYE